MYALYNNGPYIIFWDVKMICNSFKITYDYTSSQEIE